MCGINVDEIRASDKGVLGWLIVVMDAYYNAWCGLCNWFSVERVFIFYCWKATTVVQFDLRNVFFFFVFVCVCVLGYSLLWPWCAGC